MYSFMGRGVIDLPPRHVYDSVRNPQLRYTYDNMLKVNMYTPYSLYIVYICVCIYMCVLNVAGKQKFGCFLTDQNIFVTAGASFC